jgi:hypothetical protein
MRRAAAGLWVIAAIAAIALAGCGGTSAKPTAANGCQGLHTARHSTQSLVRFGAVRRLTPAGVCARFGAPQKVTRAAGGFVTWHYGGVIVSFRGDRVFDRAGFDHSQTG